MFKKLAIIPLMLFTLMSLYSQEINNIRFEQDGKMINIFYDLAGESTYEVKVYCSQDAGNTWGQPLIKVSGDVGKNQVAGFKRKIIWDVLSELEKVEGDIIFKVEALSGNETGTFKDERDGKTYKWVKIGGQVWMAENLNFSLSSGSSCNDNLTSNCDIYGLLYDWKTAKIACPTGWHLPSDEEWTELTNYLGGENVAGGKLKETDTLYWSTPNSGATNESGFTALPGGFLQENGSFWPVGFDGFWLNATELSTIHIWIRVLIKDNATVLRIPGLKSNGYSIRCLKDL